MVKVNIRGHEVFLTDEIRDYAEKKLDKLCKKYNQIIDIDLGLEENHNKTEDRAAHANAVIHIPGKDIDAHADAKTIFAAIDLVEDKLAKQLEKDKHLFHDPSEGKFHKSKRIIRRLFNIED